MYTIEGQTTAKARTPDGIDRAALRACGFKDGDAWTVQWENRRGPVDASDRVVPGAYIGMAIRTDRYGNHVEGRVHVTVK
jgi:hypothetical protein